MKRRPSRIIVVVLLCLLAGAIVNVAVAWSLSFFIDPSALGAELADIRRGTCNLDNGWVWNAKVVEGVGATRLHASIELRGLVLGERPEDVLPCWWHGARLRDQFTPEQWAKLVAREPHSKTTMEEYAQTHASAEARGWPMLTLWHGLRLQKWDEATQRIHLKSEGGVELPHFVWLEPERGRVWSQARTLPLRPIWRGLAINTVFYAAILLGGWLLVTSPFALRRWRRIKRGLCPKCAYPVGTSEVCTECGHRVLAGVNAV